DADGYVFEHANLDHDPTDFFRRGQIFASFEPDDPAPGYLREALGELGEDLACFSGDYGHWDGVLRDCVKSVARTRPYGRAHLGTVRGGTCPGLSGPRLARAVGAGGRTPAPGEPGRGWRGRVTRAPGGAGVPVTGRAGPGSRRRRPRNPRPSPPAPPSAPR